MNKPKMVLIHGWDYANYTSSGCLDPWVNRVRFVEALSRHFEIVKIRLPGFGGQPNPLKPWSLDDYVEYVSAIIDKENPESILGYSFGGAIALRWEKNNSDKGKRIFLVSPAIIRQYRSKNMSLIQKTLKVTLSTKFLSKLRDFYLTKVVRNPFYTKATPIMRETYRNIVAIDLRDDLLSLQAPVTLIYGEKDTATPPELVRKVIGNAKVKHELNVIASGGHDIANFNTEKIISLIVER
ncbi:alpha/beta hydrolase [Candidatus Parcubacteria bacterium]|nr:alpha/beta hydrolase [Candidatus Parcubacteria bacterium]